MDIPREDFSRPQEDAAHGDRVRKFTEFLDPSDRDAFHAHYAQDIRQLLLENKARLIINLDELREFDKELWRGSLRSPAIFVPSLEESFREVALMLRDPTSTDLNEETIFTVGFSGVFGSHLVSPRTLTSNLLGKLVCVEGIVTKCTIVRPKVSRTVHYSKEADEFYARDYRDQTTSFDPLPTSTTYPTQDPSGNELVMEYGLSQYRDHQVISIQEMPERAPPGQLPRGIDIVMDMDLVDLAKPGDRVQVVGVFRSVGGTGSTAERGSTFRSLLIGNNLVSLSFQASDPQSALASITDMDIRHINQLSRNPQIFELLAKSLAPSIYGFDYVKKAVLMLLLGGVEHNLENGTHIRGDINVLLVGDPSTAKSQMLRFVLNTADLAIATTGRGSTGVGLTAAVTSDKDTGERRLEAGAMVMADRGIVCVDEFDKMNDADRVAIHEVMEQQTVTISKAGIHTTLNARCSVLAAANPAYGQYDPHKEPHKNIALPDSLLSRFDLLFVVTDDVESQKDRRISEHVMKMHQYVPPGHNEGQPQRENQHTSLSVRQTAEDTQPRPAQLYTDATEQVLSIDFVKRYISYAKERIHPVLQDSAAEYIQNVYAELRNDPLSQGMRRTAPITARTLETLIRLSTAHAKSRLSEQVTDTDAEAAEAILRYAMFKEVLKPGAVKRRRLETEVEDLDLGSSDDDSDAMGEPEDAPDPDTESEDEADADATNATNAPAAAATTDTPTANANATNTPSTTTNEGNPRFNLFKSIAGQLIASGSMYTDGSTPVADFVDKINSTGNPDFSSAESEQFLEIMVQDNNIMIDNGTVYSI